MPSDVQVFVRFAEDCVFAGEDLQCTITFRNVADLREANRSSHAQGWSGRKANLGQVPVNGLGTGPGISQNLRFISAKQDGQNGDGSRHRLAMSLSIPSEFHPSMPPSRSESPRGGSMSGQGHQRAASTASGLSAKLNQSPMESRHSGISRPRPPGHLRTSTVQVTPGSMTLTKEDQRKILPRRNSGKTGAAATETAQSNFRRPRETLSPANEPHGNSSDRGVRPPPGFRFPAETKDEETPSVPGSERSSAEFHSLSNHSEETLMSEQPSLASERPPPAGARLRQQFNPDGGQQRRLGIVNLIMGYAQVNATFLLDGALINQSPFEEVKRKGFLGGQGGGGVVGMKSSRPKSGILGSFNLNSLSESFGGIIGGSDMSSVKEMQSVANSRAIPLLSTPQSLLFVDLRLAPGDEHSFRFSYRLPRGLPSSHRGKAIKITYNLTVGIQGIPYGRDSYAVRQVHIPLRVFSGVNQDGEIYGHDLMQPHIILSDTARISPINVTEDQPSGFQSATFGGSNETATEFLKYVDVLLDKNSRRQSSSGTIEAMSAAFSSKRFDQSARQAIDRAILFSNQAISGDQSPNRFEISREGLRVAVIMLDRPLHRLGETVLATIDFTESQVLCSSIRATLETTEKVSPSLAIRSAASIARVTRKIYATCSENTLFAKRVLFSPNIPESATPTFITSGVNLDWHLRFEFGVSRPDEESELEAPAETDLLEEIVADERGTTEAAVEGLSCETFEVQIPLTVYGDIIQRGLEDNEVVGLPI